MVLSPRTSKRRQISGLTPRRQHATGTPQVRGSWTARAFRHHGVRRRLTGSPPWLCSLSKISNRERVLLTVLYLRGLCTLDVLADALGVSRSAIGNVVRETRPLLQQDGHIPIQATTRYRTAAELLSAAPPTPDTPVG